MNGEVYYVDGMLADPVWFKTYELDGHSNPAGAIKSFSRIDPSTGKATAAGNAMDLLINRHPNHLITPVKKHVLHVTWDKLTDNGKTQIKQAISPRYTH